MKTWICSTMCNFFAPMQGTARVYAYVKNAGFNIELKDFNQNSYFSIMSHNSLLQIFDKFRSITFNISKNKSLRANLSSILHNSSNGMIKEIIRDNTSDKFDLYYSFISNFEMIAKKIEESRKILDQKLYSLDPDDFLYHLRMLQCAKALIDATYFPTQIDFGFGLHGFSYGLKISDILRAITDERHNFLLPYFKTTVLPQIANEMPQVIGLSIGHASDFVPAFTIANLIKESFDDIHICIGGSVLTELSYKIKKNNELWKYFDSLVIGPGEIVFCDLLEKIESNKSLSSVPNLIFKQNGSLLRSKINDDFDINEACTPEFVSIRPNQPLSLEISTGCYWGKCIFCYYPKQGLSDFNKDQYKKKRERRIDLVHKDMQKLKDKYDPLFVCLTDSAIHTERLKQIVDENNRRDEKIKFSAFIRLEKQFLSKKFCQKLKDGGFLGGQTGLESASQKSNDFIRKGVKITEAGKILKNFKDTNILIHVYSIIGIPGETLPEANMTFKYFLNNRDYFTMDWQLYPFLALENGPIGQQPSKFGITTNPLPDDILVQSTQYDVNEGLCQKESVGLSALYEQLLDPLRSPLSTIMDVESYKMVFLAMKAQGYNYEKHFYYNNIGKKDKYVDIINTLPRYF